MPGIDKTRFIDIDEDLLCDICSAVFVNPVITQCCQQTYCSDCIKEWITTRKTCPYDMQCLTNNQLSQPPRLLVNMLNKQKMKCDFVENGCLEQILYVRYKQHIKDCRHNPEAICGDCGEKNGQSGAHKCVDILVSKYKCLQNLQNNYVTQKDKNDSSNARIANLEIELINMKIKYDEKCVAFCELNQRLNNDANIGSPMESHTQRDAIDNQLIAEHKPKLSEHTIKRETDYNNNEKLSQKCGGNCLCEKCGYHTTCINNLVLHHKESYIKNAAKQDDTIDINKFGDKVIKIESKTYKTPSLVSSRKLMESLKLSVEIESKLPKIMIKKEEVSIQYMNENDKNSSGIKLKKEAVLNTPIIDRKYQWEKSPKNISKSFNEQTRPQSIALSDRISHKDNNSFIQTIADKNGLRIPIISSQSDLRSATDCSDYRTNQCSFYVRHQSASLTFAPKHGAGNYLCEKCGYHTTRMNNLVLHHKYQCSYIKNIAVRHSRSESRKRTKPNEPDMSSKTNAVDHDNENPDSPFPSTIDIVFDRDEDSKADLAKNDSICETNNVQNTTISDLDAIFMGSNDEDLPAIDNLNNTDDRVNSNDCNDSNTVSSDKNIVNSGSLAVTSSENNETVALFKERRRLSNEKLLQCIKHGKVETHLVGVYRESIFSERHRKFKCGSELEKNQLKHVPWFGPIDDEEQQEDIYDYCFQLFKSHFKTGKFFDFVAYIFEVWVPEAIVKAISSVRRIELKGAELIFAKGVILSKSEKEELRKEIKREAEK